MFNGNRTAPGAKAGERDHDRVRGFLDLRGDPVAGLDPEPDQRMSRPCGTLEQFAISQGRGVRGLESELFRRRRSSGYPDP